MRPAFRFICLAAAALLPVCAAPAASTAVFAPEMQGEVIAAEGVVRDVSIMMDGRVAFYVAGERPFTAIFDDASMIAPVDFEDALVKIEGILEFGEAGSPQDGVQILAEDVASVTVLTPPPGDPFVMPAVDASAELAAGGGLPRHRVRVHGVVTRADRPDSSFAIYAGGFEATVYPSARRASLPQAGDVVDVCAFLAAGESGARLENALVRIAGHDESKLPPYWTAGRVWILMCVVVLSLLAAGLVSLFLMRRFERTRYDATRRERMRLSHDLHDNLQQLLAATTFRLDAAQSFFDRDPDAAREQLGWAKKAVEGTQAGLRSVLWDLQEESEGPESLTGLVRYAVGRMAHWQGRVEVESSGRETPASRSLGGRFLMIIQEAVWNALSRGGAKKVRIRLFFRQGLVRLVVSDDGRGFDVSAAPGVGEGHLGLASMRQRAEELGGVFSVKSEIGRGTSVIVEVRCE